jgi:hypothetical protein
MVNENEPSAPPGGADPNSIQRMAHEAIIRAQKRAAIIETMKKNSIAVVNVANTRKPEFDGIKFRGRGFVEPYIKTVAAEDGLTILAVCAVREEERVELHITAADLCELLGGVLASQTPGYSNVVMMLDEVQRHLRS